MFKPGERTPKCCAELEASGCALNSSELQTIIGLVQAIFLQRLSIRVDSADMDLFQTGTLDSVTTVRLVPALEDNFGVSLPLNKLDFSSLRSVRAIAELICSARAAAARD